MFNILHNSQTALNAGVTIALLGLIWYWIYGRGTRGGTKQGGILGSNPFVSSFLFFTFKFSVNRSVLLFLCAQVLLCTCLHDTCLLAFTVLLNLLSLLLIHSPGLRLLITKL